MIAALAALYRVFYDGVLSRLPEPRAVALGPAALRLVPLDRLSLFRVEDPRLATTVGGVRLANPLILAAQYYDVTILGRAMGLGFGAVTAKSITRHPRPGHPEPNLVRVRTAAGPGLVNCNGFKNPGLDAFARVIAQLPHRVPLIVSVAGETPEDCVAHVRDIIPAALEAGIRVVNYGNTRRVEDARLSQGGGGLSGPEIFPATLDNIRRTRARFGDRFDLIATGGIDAPDKARALLDAGATALGYFTGFITRGPLLARRILEALRDAR